jgi:glutathione S-transferase fosA5
MITGFNHLTLSTNNLDISFEFYSNVLGCKPLAKWKQGAYLLVGDSWLCLSLNRNFEARINTEYTHYAFSLSPEQFEYYRNNIEQLNLKLWQDNTSEGDSLYILDPDNHKLLWFRLKKSSENSLAN